MFYAAFFPQFVDPARPPGPQLALLCTTFLVVATVLDGAYTILAGQVRPWLRTRRRARLRNRITGTFSLTRNNWSTGGNVETSSNLTQLVNTTAGHGSTATATV